MSNKYSHSKTKPLRAEQQRALDIRKIANQTTTERTFGTHSPKFGMTLGASYNGTTGVIAKVNRALPVL